MISLVVTEKDGNLSKKFSISEPTLDEAFAHYFSNYVNRYKYCSVNYVLEDPETKSAYNKWISNIKNYANNGGDMY